MKIARTLLLVWCTGVAYATPVTLVFDSEIDTDVRVIARRLDAADAADATIAVTAKTSTPAQLDLARGHWSLTVESDLLWHAEQLIFAGDRAMDVAVPLRRAAYISGTPVMKNGGEPPDEVLIRVDAAAREVPCPVDDGAFRCKVAAGVLDLRVRATGMVPRYFNELEVAPAKTTSLGNVVLQRGASLSGIVDPGTAKDVRVIATADAGRYIVAIGKRGHFHIDGLTPGRYRLIAATADGTMTSDEEEVVILADTLAELRDPLVVEEPKTLRLALTPPLDPWGERWNITLTRTVRHAEEELAAKTSAGENGEWAAPPLRTGRYVLELGPARGGTWLRQEIEMAGAPVELPLQLPFDPVSGTVILGDRPIEAVIRFQTEGQPSIEIRADAEGRFAGALPRRDAKWFAVVMSDHPFVKRTIRDIVPKPDLELRIPLTTLSGVVLDAAGQPAPNATVNVTSEHETLVQTPADNEGWFAAYGLAPGKYEVQASAYLAESDVQSIEVTDNLTPDPIQLVLHDVEKIVGRVVSDAAPISGAEVWVFATDVVQHVVIPMTSDARGAFGVFAPPGAREVDMSVAAPGFDFRMFHTRIAEGILTVPMSQLGGTITVPSARGELNPYLQHAGAIESAASLVWCCDAFETDGKLVMPSMEPGPYSLCYIRDRERMALRAGRINRAMQCVEGFLPPHGTLVFAAPPALEKQ